MRERSYIVFSGLPFQRKPGGNRYKRTSKHARRTNMRKKVCGCAEGCENVLNNGAALLTGAKALYAADVYLVTALVPSDTACLASSPGSNRRTAV